MPRKYKAKPRAKPRYFKPVERAGGRIVYKWEPGPTLRDKGWQARELGEDYLEAVAKAKALNDQLDAWRAGATTAMPQKVENRDYRYASWDDLERRFNGAEGLEGVSYRTGRPYSAKTRAEYRSRMKFLRAWAGNGAMKLRHITPESVIELRNTLVAGTTPHTAAAILRALSAMMGWAEFHGLIERGKDPAKKLNIPEPKARRKRVQSEVVEAVAAAAMKEGWPSIALAVQLGFYLVQRPGDLRSLDAFNWRRAVDIAPHDRAVLAGADGEVWSVRLKQQKTGAWVDLAVTNALRSQIDAAIAANAVPGSNSPTPVLVDHTTGQLWHERNFTKYIRLAINAALAAAKEADNQFMIDQLTGLQFRDLRRSGMCWMRDLGVPVPLIAARSGHSIQETQKILDTYMPADSRGSAAAIAMATVRAAELKGENIPGKEQKS